MQVKNLGKKSGGGHANVGGTCKVASILEIIESSL
jgi:hypothetical protein